jgi:hypothetical protein
MRTLRIPQTRRWMRAGSHLVSRMDPPSGPRSASLPARYRPRAGDWMVSRAAAGAWERQWATWCVLSLLLL